MDIGGFKAGKYIVKSEGGKKHLIFDYRDSVYNPSIADDVHTRFFVIKVLQEVEADLIVLSEVYERIYNEEQTNLLKEIAALASSFEVEGVADYTKLGKFELGHEADLAPRFSIVSRITKELIFFDPILAYIGCVQEEKKQESILSSASNENEKEDVKVYLNTLKEIKYSFEKTKLISQVKPILNHLTKLPDTKDLYKTFLEAQMKPAFIGSRLLYGEDAEKLEILDEYSVEDSTIQIFAHPDKTENLYFINTPEYTLTPEKYFVLSKTKEIVSGYRPEGVSLSLVAKSRLYFERIYKSTIKQVAEKYGIKLSSKDISDLSKIVARYTVGYGILEILLSDRKITDIYIDSPIGENAIYLVHSAYGQCKSNILYTENEAQALITKIRAMSGRPFDEAHPILDFDLPDFETRIAVIGPPLAPDGIAFAFRLHKTTPWTLPQFIDVKYLTPLAAGMLSFFIDNQSTILLTGSRGSGKTSLMNAAILEIVKNSRILVQEDTLEISVPYMKRIGYNIQRMKTKQAIGSERGTTEVSPEDALRTALRLGDSAIILGEVRSTEAKTLYEAMRVGAAGNVVMGTIHGDSAYSVWDRVVNDLGVPTTSFKATDLVVVARPIRFAGSLKRQKRVVQITEVKKHWLHDPSDEGGLLDLMLYDARGDKLELLEDNLKDSDLFEKISRLSGLDLNEIWADIRARAETKDYLVALKQKHNLPKILEAEYTTFAHDKFLLLKEKNIEEHGKVNFKEVIVDWKKWADSHLVKRILEEK